MEYTHILVIISIFISLSGAYSYIIDTIKGNTKPNRVSWIMWTLAPMIGVGAAIQAGGDLWSVVRIFMAGFTPLLVIIFSFLNKNSYWKITLFDALCGAMSLIALFFWIGLENFKYAILIAVIADIFASIPTLIKSWKYPETETVTVYITSLINGLITVPAIVKFDVINSSFQLYLIIINIVLILIIKRNNIKI